MLFADGAMSRPASASETPITTPAEERADHRAEAAHDHDDERQQGVRGTEPGRHVDERHHARSPATATQAAPIAEGDGVEVRDGQAGDARADRIVGAGADRLAGEGEAKERGQQRRRQHAPRPRRRRATLSTSSGPSSNESSW